MELTAFDISVVLVNSIAEVIIEDDDEGKWLNCQMHKYQPHSHALKGANFTLACDYA